MVRDPSVELLRLLADGAPADRLAEVDADGEAVRLAVQAAQRLEEQRGRERALRALVDTARDLAAATDPDSVLDAIVRRARTLLGTDTAYLTLYDPARGDTFVRATDGAVAASFRMLRLDLGVGLGGLVASTRDAWWTADYPADQRFEHTDTIDGGVGDEGLIAICGTPLLVEDKFVGVLFAADRSPRSFSPGEVALLGSLASLAAVAILQTRSRHATAAALAELSEVLETDRRRNREVERSAAAHTRFTQLVVSGGGLDDITRALGEVLDGWTVLIDGDGLRRSAFGRVPGGAVAPGEPDPLAADPIVARARVEKRAVVDGGRCAVGVQVRDEVMAVLLCGGEEVSAAERRIVERAGSVAALLLLFERETAAARQAALTDQVGDLIAGALTGVDAARLLHREGIPAQAPFAVVVLRPTEVAVSSVVLAAGAAVGSRGLVGQHGKAAVALVTGGDPGRLAVELVGRVAGVGEVTAAGVGPLRGPGEIPEAFAEASRTVDALIALGRRGQGAAATDLGFAGLIVGSDPDVGEYVERVLGPLLRHDRERGSALIATVEAYFASGRSPRRAAQRLHVHANTVAQRLERVAALLGQGWVEPEASLEVQLALRLRPLVS